MSHKCGVLSCLSVVGIFLVVASVLRATHPAILVLHGNNGVFCNLSISKEQAAAFSAQAIVLLRLSNVTDSISRVIQNPNIRVELSQNREVFELVYPTIQTVTVPSGPQLRFDRILIFLPTSGRQVFDLAVGVSRYTDGLYSVAKQTAPQSASVWPDEQACNSR
jgi:hypothetical protein